MKNGLVHFIKVLIILIALGVFFALIKMPQTEGRAEGLSLIEIYKDPFIVYIYLASIPFFIALYQTFKLLNFIESEKFYSKIAINTVKKIKYCFLSLPVLILTAAVFVRINASTNGDDITGFIALSIIAILISGTIAGITLFTEKHFTKLLSQKGGK